MTGHHLPPIVIGGVGGSGTRLVAEILLKLGIYLGSDLNEANDNLWFTLLFKHAGILQYSDQEFSGLFSIFNQRMHGDNSFTQDQLILIDNLASADRSLHNSSWLKERAGTLRAADSHDHSSQQWGWKEPNSHIVIERLDQCMSELRYIHVMRNGLDMAHSTNQNQLKLWGPHFLGAEYDLTPSHSLKFWCIVHRRIQEIGATMEGRFLMVNYDALCLSPESKIQEVTKFLKTDSSSSTISILTELVSPSPRTSRRENYDLGAFDPDDLAYVRSLGFQLN